jgi:two-component system sensor histidine kinase PilS (NtrC family)
LRESAARLSGDESWFAGEAPPDTHWRRDGFAESRLAEDAAAAVGASPDSQFLQRHPRRNGLAAPTAFERIYRTLLAARAALGVALLLTLGVSALFRVWPAVPVLVLCLVYPALSIGAWLLPRLQRPAVNPVTSLRPRQWLATIGVDIVCFTALHLMAPVAGLNYVALLVFPLLMAGVLTPRVIALGTAAAVSLMLLAVAWLNVLAGGEAAVLLSQAGLAGSGMFVVTVMASELAARLAREELTARGSMEFARQQAELNRLVIQELQDGVLVVDRRGRVRAANPVALELLAPEDIGLTPPFVLRGEPAWVALIEAVERAFFEAAWPDTGRDVVLEFEPGLSRTLRVRIRFARRRETPGSEEYCVLFLEDVRSVQARTRQEKLAAMGRVSAGIAHEIRNPLSAIAQANALLSEDVQSVEQRQLTRMVADNVDRLKRIVDDVMEVAPVGVQDSATVDASAQVAAVCGEWAHATGVRVGGPGVLHVNLPTEPLNVVFDPEHLRRVLVNLLDNARRFATGTAGAMHLSLRSKDSSLALLTVASDGAPIAPEVERYLFEPFFSTRSRGAGLGLYICRELCERHGARINFQLRPASDRHRNEFSIALRRQAAGATAAA